MSGWRRLFIFFTLWPLSACFQRVVALSGADVSYFVVSSARHASQSTIEAHRLTMIESEADAARQSKAFYGNFRFIAPLEQPLMQFILIATARALCRDRYVATIAWFVILAFEPV